ncbi:BTAD domain-containing putative transcriptional regulator [Dactylosporangium sp. NPDC000521]|uniref:AfsR/SARP family transcriptional regulator n=1 Tax=Dactylosporangium sp. NPDC000521 TaxID=3363975 RepID=UPI00369C921C
MRIGVLGPLEVRAASGAPVEIGGARLRVLVTLLALDAGRPVTGARLADGIWGGTPPGDATNALQSLVSRLRRILPDGTLVARPSGYLLDVDPRDVDHLLFADLVERARTLLAEDPAAAVALFRDAESLWRGPALEDAGEAPFVLGRRARLDELRLSATEDRTAAELSLGRRVVADLEAAVAAHPLRERLVDLLMRALHAEGRTADALRAYARCRETLAEELGADPSAALTSTYLAILHNTLPAGAGVPAAPGLTHGPAPHDAPSDHPAPARHRTSTPATPASDPASPTTAPGNHRSSEVPSVRLDQRAANGGGNLRAPLTSFVGRGEELRTLQETLGTARLVTLVGPGGAGKTRLATEAGRAAAPRDGVWIVELANVTDPGDVVQAVWTGLGMRDPSAAAGPVRRATAAAAERTAALLRIAEALSYRRILLVLDNCEHVVEAAAALADRLLGDCPHLRILATSREPLGITGEVLLPVGPLPADALDSAAVRLLSDRAAAVRPGFRLDGSALRICRALDGMPLAIELAAARCRSMTPAQVADRLDDRFRLLTRGSRTALPRHQTLRAVVDWSWDLLTEPERAMLRRLAVFPGGATLEAAAAVCDPDGALGDPVELVAALVDKSLLVEAGGRYGMLETIRAYGLQRLDEHGETARLRHRHATWFLALADRLEPSLRTAGQLESLAVLSAEHDNLHGALRRAIADGDADLAVRFVLALSWYWWMRGHRVEGGALAVAALALDGPCDPGARAMACGVAAVNGFDGVGEATQVNEWFDEAFAHQGDHPMFRLFQAVAMLFRQGSTEATIERIGTLLDDPDPWLASLGQLLLCHAEMNVGIPYDAAVARFDRALAGFRAIGERWGMAASLQSLGEIHARRGDHAAAAGHIEEGLRLFDVLGATEDRPPAEVRLAQLYELLGRTEEAEAMLAQARRTALDVGLPDGIAYVEYVHADRALRAGRLADARQRYYRAAEVLGADRASPQLLAAVHGGLAVVRAREGATAAARTMAAVALEHARDAFDGPVAGAVLEDAAEVLLLDGDPATAVTLLTAARKTRGGPDRTRPHVATLTADAEAALPVAERAAAVARGHALSIETAVDLL